MQSPLLTVPNPKGWKAEHLVTQTVNAALCFSSFSDALIRIFAPQKITLNTQRSNKYQITWQCLQVLPNASTLFLQDSIVKLQWRNCNQGLTVTPAKKFISCSLWNYSCRFYMAKLYFMYLTNDKCKKTKFSTAIHMSYDAWFDKTVQQFTTTCDIGNSRFALHSQYLRQRLV